PSLGPVPPWGVDRGRLWRAPAVDDPLGERQQATHRRAWQPAASARPRLPPTEGLISPRRRRYDRPEAPAATREHCRGVRGEVPRRSRPEGEEAAGAILRRDRRA